MSSPIPPTAHFIWLGTRFEWISAVAALTAAAHGGFHTVIVHHTDDLSANAAFRELTSAAGITTRHLDPATLFEELRTRSPELPTAALEQLYGRLTKPAARANVIRAVLLFLHGGVYLDFDTVTVASLAPLRKARVFCGYERIVFPPETVQGAALLPKVTAYSKTVLRDLIRRLPSGFRTFRKIEHRYPTAINNAIIGAAPGHPLLRDLIERMVALPARQQRVRYALGTHLLHRTVRDWEQKADPEGLETHPPGVFYPLGPEISEHWFRSRPGDAAAVLQEVLLPETRVVHWYASVRTAKFVATIDRERVRSRQDRQLISALIAAKLPDL